MVVVVVVMVEVAAARTAGADPCRFLPGLPPHFGRQGYSVNRGSVSCRETSVLLYPPPCLTPVHPGSLNRARWSPSGKASFARGRPYVSPETSTTFRIET